MENKLDYITVKGFRSIKSIEKLELRPVNVLIGPNGSGKSNFVEVFAFLNVLRQGKLEDYAAKHGGADNILHFGSKETAGLEIELCFADQVNGYHISLAPTNQDRFYVAREECWFWDKSRFPDKPDDKPISGGGREAGVSLPQERTADWVQKRFESWRIFHFHDTSDTSPIKKTADVDDNRSFRPDGSNLAPYLLYLREKHPIAFGLIRKTIQRATPFFDDFQLEPLLLNENKIKLEWKHKGSDRYFDASSLSDGTLRFICLSTLLLQPPQLRPSVILVDEPELGLHPCAITLLANMIKSAANETQVIISTQSALLLDHFEPEDVLVTERANGATSLRRLCSEDLSDWLEDYSLGQLWEKNQFGGRPGRG